MRCFWEDLQRRGTVHPCLCKHCGHVLYKYKNEDVAEFEQWHSDSAAKGLPKSFR